MSRAFGPLRLSLVRTAGAGALEASQEPDSALLARLSDDDTDALEQLIERYWPAIYAYAERCTGSSDAAADLAQDVFCRLWDRRSRWKAEGSARGLLFRLVRNAAVSRHRRGRAQLNAARTWADRRPDSAPNVIPAERAELRAALESAIAALPERRREVFLLRMTDDLSYDEIAQVMGTSRQTVANQLSRALVTLRTALARYLD